MRCLMNLLQDYGEASGQIINTSKSKFYVGSISERRKLGLAEIIGFSSGVLPFRCSDV